MKTRIEYYVAVQTIDGSEMFCFTDEADTMNFIMDIQDHVLCIALAYEECTGGGMR